MRLLKITFCSENDISAWTVQIAGNSGLRLSRELEKGIFLSNSIFKMKFGEVFNEYLHGEQEQFLNKCSHVEYKRLKKVLKSCRICRACSDKGDKNTSSSEAYEYDSCQCMLSLMSLSFNNVLSV